MKDRLDEVEFYKSSLQLFHECWNDTAGLLHDVRGKELARQLIRSVGSISANIEEGYGRGFGKEYPQFLRIARGSARESKGWYKRSIFLLPGEIVAKREEVLDGIIGMLTKAIQTLEARSSRK